MPHKTLREALDELHSQLNDTESLEPEYRAALERVRDELDLLLEPSAPDPVDLVDQVDNAVTRFEVRHPQLTALMNRIATALAAIGV